MLNNDGLALWREAGCGEWKATAAEIGKDLHRRPASVPGVDRRGAPQPRRSRRQRPARSLYGEALAAARIADDPGLEGHAFGCLSLLAKASGRPREAISAAPRRAGAAHR